MWFVEFGVEESVDFEHIHSEKGFISFPMFGSKCAIVQHMVNVMCAVLLGSVYGVCVAFYASLIRNLLGLGSVLVFYVYITPFLISTIAGSVLADFLVVSLKKALVLSKVKYT